LPTLSASTLALALPCTNRDLDSLSNDQILAFITDCLNYSVKWLIEAAEGIRELEKRGFDLRQVKLAMMNRLIRIAHGQLLPEVLYRFDNRPSLLRIVERMAIPDQQRFADGEKIKFIEQAPSGEWTYSMQDVANLTPLQIRQLFDGFTLRDEVQQRNYIVTEEKKRKAAIPSSVGLMRLDEDANGAWIARKFIPFADLETAYKALKRKLSS
jgi:hypothetical protein